jgi:hypothetical protein
MTDYIPAMSEERVRELLARILLMLSYGTPPVLRHVGLSEAEAQQLDKEGIIRLEHAGVAGANKHKEFLDRYVVVEISDKARAWLYSHPPPLPREEPPMPQKPGFAGFLLWLMTTPWGWMMFALGAAIVYFGIRYFQKHFHQ